MDMRPIISSIIASVKSLILLAACAFSFIIFPLPIFAQTSPIYYDAFSNFSAQSNPNGTWSYGYTNSLGNNFTIYSVNNQSSWSRTSDLNSANVAKIISSDYLNVNPGPAGEYSVIRWTAPASGTYQVNSSFQSPRGGYPPTTSDVHVLQNSTSIYDASVFGYYSGFFQNSSNNRTYDFSKTVTLNSGDTVDFVVGPGSDGYDAYDGTWVEATISPVTNSNQNTYDAFTDFISYSNPTPGGVWSYGWFYQQRDGNLHLNTYRKNEQGVDYWYSVLFNFTPAPIFAKNNSGQDVMVQGNGFQMTFPATDYVLLRPGDISWSVLRWKAPSAGIYNIDTIFKGVVTLGGSPFNISNNYVLRNNAVIYQSNGNGLASTPPRTFSTSLSLNADDIIDFVVGPGGASSIAGEYTRAVKATITVVNQEPPTVDAGGPYTVNEGGSVSVTATGNDPENGSLTYAWDLDGNGSFETPGQTVTFSAVGLDGPTTKNVTVQVTDNDNLTATDDVSVNVVNVSPTVGTITAPTDPALINTQINTSVSFSDPGTPDTHTAVWDWGDNLTSSGSVDEQNDTVTGSHSYTTPGVYEIKVTVTDDDSGSGESIYQYIVIYDNSASGGFVTGAGTINSPLGAYILNTSLTGIARFGFVSKYQPGANAPNGNTQFKFQAADFTFTSTDYQWLVVAGAQAKFKGSGTVNGNGNYGFQLFATDGAINGGGGVDKFRIKIWDINNNDTVVYDNNIGAGDNANPTTELTGGNIVIH